MPRNGIAGLYGSPIFNYLKKFCTVFHITFPSMVNRENMFENHISDKELNPEYIKKKNSYNLMLKTKQFNWKMGRGLEQTFFPDKNIQMVAL